jgi:death-on-curing protein
VLLIHQDQLRRYGGDPGLQDHAILSSAMAMPGGRFGGEEFHASVFDKAAAYLFHLCQNQAFVDGNNRVGLAAALVFLDLNGVIIDDPQSKLYDLVITVTAGQANKAKIAETLERLTTV